MVNVTPAGCGMLGIGVWSNATSGHSSTGCGPNSPAGVKDRSVTEMSKALPGPATNCNSVSWVGSNAAVAASDPRFRWVRSVNAMVYFCQTVASAIGVPKSLEQAPVQAPPSRVCCVPTVARFTRMIAGVADRAQNVIPEKAETS